MVRAWYMDPSGSNNPRDEQQRLPPKFITLESLYEETGVEYYQLNIDTCETDGTLDQIKQDKGGYEYEDELETPSQPDLDDFYIEHLHANNEIRFILEGCAYYDVRDKNDEWIRIEIVTGDLLVIPSGCYHRFMLDHSNMLRMKRLFLKDPGYNSHIRPADDLECRQNYLKNLQTGEFKSSA